MLISEVGSSHSSAQASLSCDTSASFSKNSPDMESLSTNPAKPSTIVTLGQGSISEVSVYSDTLSSIPLSLASAPELFVQADTNGNGSLSRDEFASQLKRAGVDRRKATAMFDSFNVSKKAELTLNDYVMAIRGSDTETRNVFQNLFTSYTTDQTGQFSTQQFASFKAQGAAVADQYWHAYQELQQRSSES